VSDAALAVAQTRYALRGYTRDRSALVFTAIFPLILLLLFNAIFKGNTQFDGRNVPSGAYYTASIISYVITLVSFGSLLSRITTARERGLLKRFRGTPMPSWIYLVSEIGRTVAVVYATVALLVVVGAIFYHVHVSAHLLIGVVIYVALGVSCFCSLALALAGVCKTADSASAIGPLAATILSFLSGVFIPTFLMPTWLIDIGKVFPLEHAARGLQSAFLLKGSTGINALDIGVLVAWAALGLLVATRNFKWEKSGAGTN
jgi:ABC-2 type transport system permease protein